MKDILEKIAEEAGLPMPAPAPVSASTVMDFIQSNPSYNAEAAELAGIPADRLNEVIYGMASKLTKFLRSGRSIEKQVSASDVDQAALKTGISHEYEHCQDDVIAKKMVLDHLADIPDYYARLTKMTAVGRSESDIAATPTVVTHSVTNTDYDVDHNTDENTNNIPWNTPTIEDA